MLKLMLEAGHLHGNTLTVRQGCWDACAHELQVTGKTMAENLAQLPGLSPGQRIISGFDAPIKDSGHIAVLSGTGLGRLIRAEAWRTQATLHLSRLLARLPGRRVSTSAAQRGASTRRRQ